MSVSFVEGGSEMKTAKYSKQKQNISSYLSPSYKEKKKAVKECAAVLTNSKVLL